MPSLSGGVLGFGVGGFGVGGRSGLGRRLSPLRGRGGDECVQARDLGVEGTEGDASLGGGACLRPGTHMQERVRLVHIRRWRAVAGGGGRWRAVAGGGGRWRCG